MKGIDEILLFEGRGFLGRGGEMSFLRKALSIEAVLAKLSKYNFMVLVMSGPRS